MTEQRTVEVSREIDATPEAIFQALTHPLELSYWLCHQAWTEPKAGGDFWVRWRNGWWARGVYQSLERPRRVALTWQGKDEPGETELVFEMEPLDQGTMVKVSHSGYGADATWDKAVAEAENSWPSALENLESVLATGIDLREASRPLMGVMLEELTLERATKEDIATESGIYLTRVTEDGGAVEAGLQQGDVITSIGGIAIIDYDSLTTTLSSYRAGDQVRVRYVRGHEHGVVTVELKPRPTPKVSFDPQQVVEQVRQEQTTVMAELRQTVENLSEQEAGKRPGTDEWSVKDVLAHLVLSERWSQNWLADIIVGTTAGQFGGNSTAVPESLMATLDAAPTIEALLACLEDETERTLAIFAALRPELVAMKARYHQMANSFSLLLWSFHARDHVDQIKAIIEALKS